MQILGLDVGTNSVGWALIEVEGDYREDGTLELGNIHGLLDWGVRIFPEGAEIDQGKEISRNVQRRTYRGMRRRLARYRLRRDRLIKLLKEKGFPELQLSIPPRAEWKGVKPRIFTAKELYGLRAKGLDEQLTLEELARVFHHLNRRRGFRSNRKGGNGEEKKEKGIVDDSIKALKAVMKANEAKNAGRVLCRLVCGSRIRPTGGHNPTERIRGRYVGREQLSEEFDLLWDAQKVYYPTLLTGKRPKKLSKGCRGRKKKT